MKKSKNKKLTFLFSLGGLVTLGISTFALTTCGSVQSSQLQEKQAQKDLFKPIIYDDIVFKTEEQLYQYIQQNAIAKNYEPGKKVFTVDIGNKQKNYDSYEEALFEVESRIERKTVFLKYDADIEQTKLGLELSPESFIEKKDTVKYVIFKRLNGSYTFAMASNEEAVKKARLEAAKTYIEVHNALYFDGTYFKSKSDLQVYLHDKYQKEGIEYFKRVSKDLNTQYKEININGAPYVMSLDDLNKENPSQNFKNKVVLSATPFYHYDDLGNEVTTKDFFYNNESDLASNGLININYDNADKIAAKIKSNDLNYISINYNKSETLQIVDMDSSTKHGNLYGPYFYESGAGLTGIKNPASWYEYKSDDKSFKEITKDQSILLLTSIISYAINGQGFSSPIEIFYNILLQKNDLETNFEKSLFEKKATLIDFLQTIVYRNSSDPRFNNYAEIYNDFIDNLSKGSRFNYLDAIIASYSFLINHMIQNRISSETIITLTKYFDSISVYLDKTIWSQLLAPFFSKNDSNEISNIAINDFSYFQSAFNFYNKNSTSKDSLGGMSIDFQSNPYSYYQRLISGVIENDTTTKANFNNNKGIFELLKAATGVQILITRGLTNNDEAILKWLGSSYYIEPSLMKVPKREDLTDFTDLIDFTFSVESEKDIDKYKDYDEYKAVWSNIEKIDTFIEIGKERFDRGILLKNYVEYIKDSQNPTIKKYNDALKEEKTRIINTVFSQDFLNAQAQNYLSCLALSSNKKNWTLDEMISCVEVPSELANPRTILGVRITEPMSPKDYLWSLSEKNRSDTYETIDTFKLMENYKVVEFHQHSTLDSQISLQKMIDSTIRSMDEIVLSFVQMVRETIIDVSTAFTATSKVFTSFYAIDFKDSISEVNKMSAAASGGRAAINAARVAVYNKYARKAGVPNIYNTKVQGGKFIPTTTQGFKNTTRFINNAFKKKEADLQKTNAIISKTVNFLLNPVQFVRDLPIISSILKWINRFSFTDHQTFVYQAKDQFGTKFYWDGGIIDYSWWGFKVDVVSTITDLKLIEIPQIISGYRSSGYYYGNKMYADINEIRQLEANKYIDKVSEFLQKQVNEPIVDSKVVEWGIKLTNTEKNKTKLLLAKTTDELINKILDLVNKNEAEDSFNHYSKKIYDIGYGVITSDSDIAYKTVVADLIKKLLPVTIVRLPLIKDGKIELITDFKLPFPYYHNQAVIKEDEKTSPNDRLLDKRNIVFNPNNEINEKEFLKGTPEYDTVNKILTKQRSTALSIEEIEKIVEYFAEQFNVEHKEAIYEEINDFANEKFDEFQTTLQENEITIFTYLSLFDSQSHYFIKEKDSILGLLQEMRINIVEEKVLTSKYIFKNQEFATITSIYNYVLSKGEEYHEA